MATHLKYSSSYSGTGKWYKGNLHAHCVEHSGHSSIPLKKLIAQYVERIYDFLAITDHDHFTKLANDITPQNMLIIPGFEFSTQKHMQLIGVEDVIRLDQQLAILQANDQGGFVILSHPNWGEPPHWSFEQIMELEGYHGIEIFSGNIDRLIGKSDATEVWDALLTKGKHCLGFASDNCHDLFDIGRAWIMVRANKREYKDILRSLKTGDFYSTTGAELKEIKLIENKIYIETDQESAFRFIGPNGKIIKTHLGHLAEYWLEGWEDYVRVEGYNQNGWFWTQPFYGL